MFLPLTETEPVLVIAPHPDDEVPGARGAIAPLTSAGCEVQVCIATRRRSDRLGSDQIETVRAEAKAAHAIPGVHQTHWLDDPAVELDTEAHGALNGSLAELVERIGALVLMVPRVGDIHLDHQGVFLSAMATLRGATGHRSAAEAFVTIRQC